MVKARNPDEWTVERWRTEPRWHTLGDLDESQLVEQPPPLWLDLTVASVAAALLWTVAVLLLG
jgi:hypothetical protein